MKCERCKKNNATIHLTEIIKNVRSEIHICETCSKEIGFNINNTNDLLFTGSSLGSVVTSIGKSCSLCGMHVEDFLESGITGCPQCYDVFDSEIRSMTGNYRYSNKVPEETDGVVNDSGLLCGENESQILTSEFLKQKLEKAVLEERYEDAAIIRDVIFNREGVCRVKE